MESKTRGFRIPKHIVPTKHTVFRPNGEVNVPCEGGKIRLTLTELKDLQNNLSSSDGADVICPRCLHQFNIKNI